MTIQVGQTLPNVTFLQMGESGPQPINTQAAFKGKRVALFAVPGAYTPTCSAQHVPSFKEHEAALRAKGIDSIACTSVNDVFVMDAWAKDQGVEASMAFLADGNGEFAKAIGLELDGSGFGLGQRSQRYAMIVNDGVVEQLHIEGPGEYKVSSAEYLLENL